MKLIYPMHGNIFRVIGLLVVVTFSVMTVQASEADRVVPESRMKQVYEAVKTPYKYGLVLAPDRNNCKMDCPTVFRNGSTWYMSYLVYNGKEGDDGRGYETWLATSPDLLHWETLGKILPFKESGWDKNQRGGYVALIDNTWGGSYRVNRFKGRYWMTYIGGDTPGYERGMLQIGLAWTKGPVGTPHPWESLDRPVLSPKDPDAGWWENITQYKSSVFWDKSERLGAPFVLFYNAAGISPTTGIKGERIGLALSEDMVQWKRYPGNPVINHEGGITGDAVIQKMGDLYVLFYFSAFRPGVPYKAFNSFCCSYDLVHWTDWTGDKLIYPSEPYDELFAHKSCVIRHEGVVYHFYCAVNKADQRGIALATSVPLGRSQVSFPEPAPNGFRQEVSLNGTWQSFLLPEQPASFTPLSDSLTGVSPETILKQPGWVSVQVPHNWDQYYGLRRVKHGNLHGTAWYYRTFQTPVSLDGKRCFLFFEGAGSYATVYVNGKMVGAHRGGRTTFTLDVTDALNASGENRLLVKTEHPSMIADLPWVCGGCSGEIGFSEGSQPLGLFRPVTLVVTDEVRVEPFGVHLWTNSEKSNSADSALQVVTTLKNYGRRDRTVEVISKLVDEDGIQVARVTDTVNMSIQATQEIHQEAILVKTPHLWSPDTPYLYTLITMLKEKGKVIDEYQTKYGFRTVSWPQFRKDGDNRLLINGSPYFINGICEYEHLNGMSHAFSDQQIKARVAQLKAAGFNAFRDAHQPHNLRYQTYWDEGGILWWPQFSAHIWYDTPAFRSQFKQLLKEWVIERRNSPSLILWGLQNESTLPADFARECVEFIRSLDPTASRERLITTCNGGQGTDWNVPQNWSGTYGGDPYVYGKELTRQLLNGEYGAWRTIDRHTEGEFVQDGPYSEERFCQLMELKIRQAEQYRDSVCGHFMWLFNSHDNPGRTHYEEGLRDLDRVGPFNYKGLITSWGEPVDAYYLYRSFYASKQKEPMVYIVSHTWPDRWTTPGIKNGLVVYSNCDSVELFNDIGYGSLGRKPNPGKGYHFQWDSVPIHYNTLLAVGYVAGKPMARDCIRLPFLPEAPHLAAFDELPLLPREAALQPVTLKGVKGARYIYRVNCGGSDYKDIHGQLWSADVALSLTAKNQPRWGSSSWTDSFKECPPYLGSQRQTWDPVRGTEDEALFQTFRYGTNRLRFSFPVSPGRYLVELYFIEPWYGTGGGLNAAGWRVFDVAINDTVRVKDLDIWQQVGHDAACKLTVEVPVNADSLAISFPRVRAGQAFISAVAIARLESSGAISGTWAGRSSERNKKNNWTPVTGGFLSLSLESLKASSKINHWLNRGDCPFGGSSARLTSLPRDLYGADWITWMGGKKATQLTFSCRREVTGWVAFKDLLDTIQWKKTTGFESTGQWLSLADGSRYPLYTNRVPADVTLQLTLPSRAMVAVTPYFVPAEGAELRQDIRLEAEQARWEGVVHAGDSLFGKACINISTPGPVLIEWKVSPGLAGIYTMRFRYVNTREEPVRMKIQIVSEDDRLVREDTLQFPPASDKWRVISTTRFPGSMRGSMRCA
jgi:hypothetical protein